MPQSAPLHIKTVSQFHQVRGLPRPQHPLISVVDFADMKRPKEGEPLSIVNSFYTIAIKRDFNGKMRYGQQIFDFDEGIMICIAPGQVYSILSDQEWQHKGWMIVIHPDFLWNTPLAQAIKKYEFFSYAVHEALHLSEKEEMIVNGIVQNLEHEYNSNIDRFSKDLIIAQLELLFTYAERFYHRQFITRQISNHQLLERLEAVLAGHFNQEGPDANGVPTVQSVASALNVSPNYLSGVLRVLTGQSTQQHIHDKLIEKAKERLTGTTLTVSEIAYELGFEHSQSFSKLFRQKTNVTPLEYRRSFN